MKEGQYMNNLLEQILGAKIDELKSKKIFRHLTVLESAQGPHVRIKGRAVINLASNNYLGLASHPRMIEAALRATHPDLSVIFISGYAAGSLDDLPHREGITFLPKPFSPDELKHVVARGLERRFLELEFKELREEKARMEANFVTLVSHQMRSPLAAVRQLMEVVATESLGPLPDAYREMVGRAVGRLDDLLHSLNAWLAMSRLAEAGINERRQPTGLKGVMAELVQRAQVDAAAAGQTLVVEEDPAGDVELSLDRETLLEALYNLASNAVKYNRSGGRVWLRSRISPYQVDIEVADEGPGIPEAEQPFIFNDFFRSKSPELKTKPGTGLGLSIARRVVKAHRGEISVHSRLGQGAAFTVSLPR